MSKVVVRQNRANIYCFYSTNSTQTAQFPVNKCIKFAFLLFYIQLCDKLDVLHVVITQALSNIGETIESLVKSTFRTILTNSWMIFFTIWNSFGCNKNILITVQMQSYYNLLYVHSQFRRNPMLLKS